LTATYSRLGLTRC